MDKLPPFDKIGVTPVPDFQNADPATSNPGSIVNALIFNQLQDEGINLEEAVGLPPNSSDLTQWSQALARGLWVGNYGGTGDLIVATLGVVFPAYLQGMKVGGYLASSNGTTSPRLRVMNLGSAGGYADFPILKEDGSQPAVGELKIGRRYRFEADGAGNVMVSGGGIGITPAQDIVTTATTTTINQIFSNSKLTTFNAGNTVTLNNNDTVKLSLSDASTPDFTNNGGFSGFAVQTPGVYELQMQVSSLISVNGAAPTSYALGVLKNNQFFYLGADNSYIPGTGNWSVSSLGLTAMKLALNDLVIPAVAFSIGGNVLQYMQATGYSLSFNRIV